MHWYAFQNTWLYSILQWLWNLGWPVARMSLRLPVGEWQPWHGTCWWCQGVFLPDPPGCVWPPLGLWHAGVWGEWRCQSESWYLSEDPPHPCSIIVLGGLSLAVRCWVAHWGSGGVLGADRMISQWRDKSHWNGQLDTYGKTLQQLHYNNIGLTLASNMLVITRAKC